MISFKVKITCDSKFCNKETESTIFIEEVLKDGDFVPALSLTKVDGWDINLEVQYRIYSNPPWQCLCPDHRVKTK